MRYLLDTHIILWTLSDDDKLPLSVRSLIQNPALMLISGKEYASMCSEMGLVNLPVENKHVCSLETLCRPAGALPHNDPLDRIMLAQAKAEGFVFVTHDSLLPGYNEPCVMSV